MNLFGCKFCDEYGDAQDGKKGKVCDRKNFDSLLWATVTVFQVRARGKENFKTVFQTFFFSLARS